MNTINILAENVSLREILNNLNSSLYEVNNYDNIRITSHNKPNFVILSVEAYIQFTTDNVKKLFENENKLFESTFNDYVVVSNDENDSVTISLFELILSSEILNIDIKSKWSLDSLDFDCIEIDYVPKNELNLEMTDMKELG